jgi:hypothetical protein
MAGRGRPKGEIDRPRSIRIPCSEEEFAAARALAHKNEMNLADYLRSLIVSEAVDAGIPMNKRRTKR